MKYAVAFHIEGDENKVKIVNAEDEIQAIATALEEGDFQIPYSSFDEALQHYFEGDIHISRPVRI